jgi:hypothetical protein
VYEVKCCICIFVTSSYFIIIIIIIILHVSGRLTCFGKHALPSFSGASTICSLSMFVDEGVFSQYCVVNSFNVIVLLI